MMLAAASAVCMREPRTVAGWGPQW